MPRAKKKPSSDLWVEKEIDLIVKKISASFSNTIHQLRTQIRKEQAGAKHLETAAMTLMKLPQTDKRDLALIVKAMAILSDQSLSNIASKTVEQTQVPMTATKVTRKRKTPRKRPSTKKTSTRGTSAIVKPDLPKAADTNLPHTPAVYQEQFV